MFLLDHVVDCASRKDRVEIYPFYDIHCGKRNCAEDLVLKERAEIIKRSKLPNRYVRVLFGGDAADVIKPNDIRFDFNDLPNWMLEGDADSIKDKLNDIAKAQVRRLCEIFDPVSNLIIGSIEANHDKVARKRYNTDTHKDFCKELGILPMTDEAIIRFRFRMGKPGHRKESVIKLYMRHGYGGGRTPGIEPNKIARMMGDGVGADCDICLTGHTHTFCKPEPVPMLFVPSKGRLPTRLLTRYRFGLNPGSWLYSHLVGYGSYESAKCYPTRAIMTSKIVIWPFWHISRAGIDVTIPKIEIRSYPLL